MSFISLSSKNSFQQAQQIHKKIGNDLISIKKQYPITQSTIYPVLDQVSQLYKISRNAIQKKNEYKQKITLSNTQLTAIYQENNELKQRLASVQKLNEENNQKFEQINKQLKTREMHVAMLAKERENLHKKVNQFEEQQLQQLEKSEELQNEATQTPKHPAQEEITKEKTELNEKDQNLNRTSISEPSSPR